QSLAFSPDGKTLAVGNRLRASLWEVPTGKKLHELSQLKVPIHTVAFSPDGKTLAAGGESMGGFPAPTIGLWNVATGKERGQIGRPLEPTLDFAFSPDGKRIVVASTNALEVWGTATGKRLSQREVRIPFLTYAFSPDGKTAASYGNAMKTEALE